MEDSSEKKKKDTWIEEIEVAGDKLVNRVKELAKESSVRQVKIIADDGDVFLETPLNIGLSVVLWCLLHLGLRFWERLPDW
jgi:CMP-2-keto-3-deoxyoctulosonic acid synthetase